MKRLLAGIQARPDVAAWFAIALGVMALGHRLGW
jgi:hypothetical protein